ncbi:hypothetical protein [Synechococcus elongatus]|nr:hypothetical protein [Synechococcus elongatus]
MRKAPDERRTHLGRSVFRNTSVASIVGQTEWHHYFAQGELLEAATALDQALSVYPELDAHGFNSLTHPKSPLTELDLPQIALCLRYLSMCDRTAQVNRKIDSYWLKHRIEALYRLPNGWPFYVSNGALIAAAIGDGLNVKPTKPWSHTAYLSISTRSVKALTERSRSPQGVLRLEACW